MSSAFDHAKYCTRCIMNDVVDPQILFDTQGVCNHCLRFDNLRDSRAVHANDQGAYQTVVDQIKEAGRDKEYDCIVGVSGGVDSTYVLYSAVKAGLRPLAVHLDNGWNTDLAVSNIERVVKKLNVDLYTHVLNWNEFRNLQLSFLYAGTPDLEIPTDHAIDALVWDMARKFKVKYILSGMNFATESISVPHWAYGHSDWKYITSIHKRFLNTPLSNFPHFSIPKLLWTNLTGVRIVSLLNYLSYNKSAAMDLMMSELDWRPYPVKHGESLYTVFVQNYILPRKFNIDKRYGHLSDLVNSGQITRDDALNKVKAPLFESNRELANLRDYVLRKMGLSVETFEGLLMEKPKTFRLYPNNYNNVQRLRRLVNIARKFKLYPY